MRTGTLLSVLIVGSTLALAARLYQEIAEPLNEIGSKPQYPKPSAMYSTDGHNCQVFLVPGETTQFWRCDDGCMYIGFWTTEIEKRLVCPTTAQGENR